MTATKALTTVNPNITRSSPIPNSAATMRAKPPRKDERRFYGTSRVSGIIDGSYIESGDLVASAAGSFSTRDSVRIPMTNQKMHSPPGRLAGREPVVVNRVSIRHNRDIELAVGSRRLAAGFYTIGAGGDKERLAPWRTSCPTPIREKARHIRLHSRQGKTIVLS